MARTPAKRSTGKRTRQRSFRLPERTLARLEAHARELGVSGNSLAQRLLDESLHTDRHPLVYFREGAGGVRRPALIGTRLYVWQAIGTLKGSGGSISEAAEYLSLPEDRVRACVAYYADFKDEVDAWAEEEDEIARREEERWSREHEVLA